MSYATPFSLLSFHLPDRDDSVAERLSWPLAGSVLLHAVVFVALLGLRFASSLEQSSGSYEVTLVTLPEIAASPTAPPAKESRLKKRVDKVLPPQAKARQAETAAPQSEAVIPPSKTVRPTKTRSPVSPRVPKRSMDAFVSEPKSQVTAIPPKVVAPPVAPDHRPTLKQNIDKLLPPLQADVAEVPKPERVTESFRSALDSVVVPKPQARPVLPQKAATVQPAAPAPVKRAPAVEMDVPSFKAPPQPPKLVVGKSKTSTPTPAPKVSPLAPKLKKAVSATVVPKKPEQVAKRVSPAVASKRKQKQVSSKAPESPAITLPSRAPRLAAAAPLEVQKKETPLQAARKISTAEALKEAIQSVQIPDRNSKKNALPPVKQPVPLVSDPVIPQAPPLAEVQEPVRSQSTVAKNTSEPDTPLQQEIDVSIPDLLSFDAHKVSKQTESGEEERRGLRRAGFCSQNNPYWKNVEDMIDSIHGSIYRYHYRVTSPAVLTFRVERNGQVTNLAVVRSSGNEKFDMVAKSAVEAASPLPLFPTKVTKPFCQVRHKFEVNPNS